MFLFGFGGSGSDTSKNIKHPNKLIWCMRENMPGNKNLLFILSCCLVRLDYKKAEKQLVNVFSIQIKFHVLMSLVLEHVH